MKKMLQSALARSIGFIPQGVATLLISYVVIDRYGVDAFSSYAMIASVMLLIPLNGLGIGASVTQAVAAHGPTSDFSLRTGRTASRAMGVSMLFLIVVSLALGAWGLWPRLLGDAAGANSWTVVAMILFGLSFVPGLGPNVLLGAERNHVAILGQSAQAPIALLLVGLLVLADGDAALVIVVPAAALLGVNLLTMALSARLTGFPWGRILREVGSRRRYPGERIRSLSGPMMVTSLCVPIAFLCDRIILSHVSTTQAVAEYTLVIQIFAPVTGLIVAAAQPLWPMYTRARAQGGHGPRLGLVLGVFAAGTVATCAVLVVVADPVGRAVSGGEIELGLLLPVLTALVMCLQAVAYPLGMSLMDPAGARFVATCAVITLPANITVSVLLSRELGAPGPLISLLLVSTCVQVVPTALYARRRIRSGASVALS